MRVSWESSPPGVMFAGEVKTCTREGRQFGTSPSTKAGTPCRVFPMEAKQGGRSRAVYGGGGTPETERAAMVSQGAHGRADKDAKQKGRVLREVVLVRDEDTGEPTFQIRIQAEPMTERQRSEAMSVYREAEGFQTDENEGEQRGDEGTGQEQGASTGKE